jgi:hypothetical protein
VPSSSSPLPFAVCHICGPGNDITIPAGIVTNKTCEEADRQGKNGEFTANECYGYQVSASAATH